MQNYTLRLYAAELTKILSIIEITTVLYGGR